MTTLRQCAFPALENEFVESMLRQLVNQFAVIQIFYNKPGSLKESYLVIHLKQKQDADQLQARPWVEKARSLYNIHVYSVYSTRLHYQFSIGHPFVELNCRLPAVIYENEAAGNPLRIKRSWTKYKKKFHDFKERFYSGHEGQHWQLQKLIAEGAVNSVFMAYERLIGYDLDCLEDLYIGDRSTANGLDERINHLVPYIPEIQSHFVRKNSKKFYLTELFANARKGIEEGEIVSGDALFEAVGISEKRLYQLIEERFAALKKRIKKGSDEKPLTAAAIDIAPVDGIPDVVLAAILKAVAVEQVYLFHQTNYGEKRTHYLLLIACGVGNEKLRSLTESLKSKTGGDCDFVLISHERYWIQKNLFQYQQFFSGIVKSKNLIYSSSDCHPEFHWEKPHEPHHGDLYLYYKATRDTAMQFFRMADNENENHQGLANIFTLFFLSFCRTYISAKTFYTPNTLSNRALWQLAVYADAEMHRCEYLFGQFPGDFFRFLDKYTTLHHRSSRHSKEEVDCMLAVVEKLQSALCGIAIEGGLPEEETALPRNVTGGF